MTAWEKPSFIEVDMSAEIGGYQGDDDQRPGHMPDFLVTGATGATGTTTQPVSADA